MASIFVFGIASCGTEQSAEIGPEPSIGTPQTLFRDSPVVTAELDVLGTVQVAEGEEIDEASEESALTPVGGTSRTSPIWFAVVGLGLVAIVTTGVAAVRGH